MLTAAQNVQNIDYLFTGETLGHKSDIADGSLRRWEFRKYDNIQGDYYISPRFLEHVAVRARRLVHACLTLKLHAAFVTQFQLCVHQEEPWYENDWLSRLRPGL